METALCLDPSTTCIGWAIVEKQKPAPRLIDSGFYKPHGKTAYERIDDAHLWMLDLGGADMLIDTVVIEDTTHGFYPSAKTGAIMGAMDYMIHSTYSPFLQRYSPAEIKRAATGHGDAKKGDVILSVARLWGMKDLPQEDQADALAIAWLWGHM